MVVSVENGLGKGFDYFVVNEKCRLKPGEDILPRVDVDIDDIRVPSESLESLLSPGTANGSDSSEESVSTRQADTCFGSYEVAFRIRKSIYHGVDFQNWSFTDTRTIQTVSDDRWSRLLKITLGISREESGPSPGQTDYLYEVTDSEGEVINSNAFSMPLGIPSRMADLSLEDRCRDRALDVDGDRNRVLDEAGTSLKREFPMLSGLSIGPGFNANTSRNLGTIIDAWYKASQLDASGIIDRMTVGCIKRRDEFFRDYSSLPKPPKPKKLKKYDAKIEGLNSSYDSIVKAGKLCPATTKAEYLAVDEEGKPTTVVVDYKCDRADTYEDCICTAKGSSTNYAPRSESEQNFN
jgi:hypothetical protein